MAKSVRSRCKCGEAAILLQSNFCKECWSSLWWQAIDLSMKGELQTPVSLGLDGINQYSYHKAEGLPA
jgi:hypothetical protein